MKKYTLILALILCVQVCLAQRSRTVIRFRISDDSPLALAIDGRYYPDQSRSLTVGNLPPGSHTVKVFSVPRYKGERRILLYEGCLRTRPFVSYSVVVDRRRHTALMTRIGDDRDYYADEESSGGVFEYDVDQSNGEGGRSGRRKYDERWEEPVSMTSGDMEALHQRVNERITDTDKLRLLKTVLSDKPYNTTQIAEMLKWLSFDSSRLEFAKWAYDDVSDKSNYWKLESAFSFDSSKDELSEYIRARR